MFNENNTVKYYSSIEQARGGYFLPSSSMSCFKFEKCDVLPVLSGASMGASRGASMNFAKTGSAFESESMLHEHT
jgi:hypothetical protein